LQRFAHPAPVAGQLLLFEETILGRGSSDRQSKDDSDGAR